MLSNSCMFIYWVFVQACAQINILVQLQAHSPNSAQPTMVEYTRDGGDACFNFPLCTMNQMNLDGITFNHPVAVWFFFLSLFSIGFGMVVSCLICLLCILSLSLSIFRFSFSIDTYFHVQVTTELPYVTFSSTIFNKNTFYQRVYCLIFEKSPIKYINSITQKRGDYYCVNSIVLVFYVKNPNSNAKLLVAIDFICLNFKRISAGIEQVFFSGTFANGSKSASYTCTTCNCIHAHHGQTHGTKYQNHKYVHYSLKQTEYFHSEAYVQCAFATN